jgi:hypothetical protein
MEAYLHWLALVVEESVLVGPLVRNRHLLEWLSLGDDLVVPISPPKPTVVICTARLIRLRWLHLRLAEILYRPVEKPAHQW